MKNVISEAQIYTIGLLNRICEDDQVLFPNANKNWWLKITRSLFYVILLFIFAKMTISVWYCITFSTEHVQDSSVRRKEKQRDAENFNTKNLQLISLQNWFGEYQPIVGAERLPTTIMGTDILPNIVLRGIAYGVRPGAVLEENGKQQVYLQGETLSSCKAKIESISRDYVMLHYQGKVIRLTLADDERPAATAKSENGTSTDAALHPEISVAADTFASLPPAVQQALATDPRKFFDYIRFSPVHKGDIAGYAVMPGADRSLFDISGLKAGDIAIALNEQDFTQPGAINIFMQQIYSMASVRLTVLRNGERHNISVALR